ncbi:NAD(P)H-hydrate epimerase [Fluviicoccus keumensis]|uniref:Bifunctional NAD(P)H-hydrate repair enzyme n=1 Tax=Fluviicoccus keumensis TaxID=1435465 RepID=A0A4Q7ZAS9_9GAMM|nr:NAD(P)H-hydrate dehydratase [Fluviicoccus keumensis]RZU47015.1 NAD(P)H-hydrate epimerase [Fluviicoccus keumensis]
MEKHVYNSRQIRDIEQKAFASGIASESLMQRAGSAVFTLMRQQFSQARKIVVLCGPGNNGGDGYVVARLAREAGLDVCVQFSAPPKTQDAKTMAALCEQTGVVMSPWDGSLKPAEIYVDALLGIGLNAPVTGMLAAMVSALNHLGRPVVAIDVPSGINADSGAVMGMAVRAALTVTFIGYKPGLLTGEGASHTGRLVLKHLRLTPHFYPPTGVAGYLSQEELRFPRRPRNAHKGNFGHVLVIGGDEGMGGAVMMAAEAALRAGAGRVSVATHPTHVSALLARCPEVMVRGLTHAEDLVLMMESADMMVVGPGLGRLAWGQRLWALVRESQKPMVVDADALFWLAQEPFKRDNRVLTPHPGEAGLLLESYAARIQDIRPEAAQSLVERYGGVVVLKGAGTLVCSSEGMSLCPAGNPGMATAGMGDILAGLMGGLCAQFGISLKTAGEAVLVHALAGDAAATGGQRGLLATDLLPHIRELMNR